MAFAPGRRRLRARARLPSSLAPTIAIIALPRLREPMVQGWLAGARVGERPRARRAGGGVPSGARTLQPRALRRFSRDRPAAPTHDHENFARRRTTCSPTSTRTSRNRTSCRAASRTPAELGIGPHRLAPTGFPTHPVTFRSGRGLVRDGADQLAPAGEPRRRRDGARPHALARVAELRFLRRLLCGHGERRGRGGARTLRGDDALPRRRELRGRAARRLGGFTLLARPLASRCAAARWSWWRFLRVPPS